MFLMKKLFTLTLLFLSLLGQWAMAQDISVNPNEGRLGEFLPVTVVGENTNFTQFSQGSQAIWVYLQQGSSTLITSYNTVVESNTEATGSFYIPANAEGGYYDLVFGDAQGFPIYASEDAFEVLLPSLVTVDPEGASRGQTLDVSLIGNNTVFTQGSITTAWFMQGSNTIYSNSVEATTDEMAIANFQIPIDAECGIYDTYVNYGANSDVTISKTGSFSVACMSQINGSVYFDENTNNEYNFGEGGVPQAKIHVMPGDFLITTDANGYYYLDVEPGDYTLTVIPPDYYTAQYPSIDITIDEMGQIESQVDFGLMAQANIHDLRVQIASDQSISEASKNYWITLKNVGTTPLNATLKVSVDPLVNIETTSISPDQFDAPTTGQELTWELEDFVGTTDIFLQAFLLEAELGTPIISKVEVLTTEEDMTPENNEEILVEEVTEVSESNEKMATSSGDILEDMVLLEDELIYTIHFQNTSDEEVSNLIIEDPIDANLDLATFEVIGASHAYIYSFKDDYSVVFEFNDINLAPSNITEHLSKGFVKYSIAPKENTPENTIVQNTGYLRFDDNEPISTNTTENTLVEMFFTSLSSLPKVDGKVRAVPNPVTDKTELILDEYDSALSQLNIYSLDGRLVRSQDLTNVQRIFIQREDLKSGAYLYEVIGSKIYTGKLVVN